MREIKFRAWDKEQKIMYEGVWNLPLLGNRIDKLTLGKSGFTDLFSVEKSDEGNFELQQYTGLLDRNGTEIYEGDLIHDTGNDLYQLLEVVEKNGAFQTYNTGKLVPSCPYKEDLTYYKPNDSYNWQPTFALNPGISKRFEVIGNRYQNPELLK